MPAFIIHALGRPAQKILAETPPVRVGRDPTNDIVLPDEAVSREHAVFVQVPGGRWQVSCVSDTNPLVVDGKIVTAGVNVQEGTEILVGENHLIIFSENEYKADSYMGTKTAFAKSECQRCKWQGMISTHRREPVCPRCAFTEFTPLEGYQSGVKSQKGAARTAHLDPAAAQQMFQKLKTAKLSYLERADTPGGASNRTEVLEDKPVELGGSDPALKLAGFVFGKVRVAWNGEHFVAESNLLFPGMRVNGEKIRSAQLRNGDVIEVGSNRIRFVTG